MPRIVRTLALAALLAGCAGGALRRHAAAPLSDYVAYAGPPVASFHFFRLDSWQAVGPRQVVIWTTAFDAYLVTVREPCPELEFSERLGVTSTGGTVSKFESLLVGHGYRCPVEQIRPIDLKQMQVDRAAERAATKAASGPR
jgi:hypothetical protein